MSRPRSDQGFTIVEMVVAMMVLSIVVAGAMTMMQVVLRQSRGTVERTDAMQRGRLVLDTLTREIRSQVCLNPTTYGLYAGADDSITFYTDFGDGTTPTELHRLTYDPAALKITRTVWDTTSTGPVGYPNSPKRTEIVATRIDRAVDSGNQPLPMFAYWAYNTTASPPTLNDRLTAADLSTPAERVRTAKIDIAFKAQPAGSKKDEKFGTQVQDSVFLRSADPNATTPDPTCR